MKKYWLISLAGVLLTAAGAIFYSSESGSVDFSDPMTYVICAGILCMLVGAALMIETGRKRGQKTTSRDRVRTVVLAGLFATLSYLGFQVFRIDIPVGADGKTAIHLGNAFLVLGSMFLGGGMGGLSGAVGMSLADLTSGYVISMPKTFLIKFVIGALAGILSENVFKLQNAAERKDRLRKSALTAGVALLCNVVLDPLLSYLYKRYLFGIPQDAAAIFAKIDIAATAVNAVVSVFVIVLAYCALRPALDKNHLL